MHGVAAEELCEDADAGAAQSIFSRAAVNDFGTWRRDAVPGSAAS